MGGTHNDIPESTYEPLTRRERDVLKLLAEGLSSPEIAQQLVLATSTVKSHRQQIYAKLGVRSKRQAIDRARALGLLGHAHAVPAPDKPSQSTPPQHNLPLQVTRFFGRESELAHLKARLGEHRLVTLTGAGGVGKTRLAIRVAGGFIDIFRDGVWLVELAPLALPALVPHQVAAALSVSEEAGQPILDTLIRRLRGRHVLLLLDNCEHLLEACSQLADRLLRACPGVTILATTREPLAVAGEVIFSVSSLAFPDAELAQDVEVLGQYPAMRLLVDRARLVQPDFQLTRHNAAALVRICRQLDGIPLALELAAARLRLLDPAALAARLDDAIGVLTGGNRTALPRQQTLRATLDWSRALLDEAERLVLERLSVFAGGCTLEAAEAVCSGNGLEAGEVLEMLAGLVDKSMVIAERQLEKEWRYRLLEMVRQYADDMLTQADDREIAHRQHLAFFQAFAGRALPHLDLHDAQEVVWYNRLEDDLDNVRAALRWALDHDLQAALSLAAALFWFWQNRGSPNEGRQWLRSAVDAEARERGDAPLTPGRAQLRVDAVLALAYLMQGDMERASPWFEEALELLRQLGPAGEPRMSHVCLVLAKWAMVRGDQVRAQALKAESLSHLPESDEYFDRETVLNILAEFARAEGDYALARTILEQRLALIVKQGQGSNGALLSALMELGETTARLGEELTAKAMYANGLAVALEVGQNAAANACQSELAHIERRLGHHDQARANYASTIQAWQRGENPGAVAHQLECFAFIAQAQSQAHRAARLLGAAEALREDIGSPMTPGERVEYDREVLLLRLHLAEPAFASAWAEGRALTKEQAIAEALTDDAAQAQGA